MREWFQLPRPFLARRNIELHTKRLQQTTHGIKPRFGSRLERLVETLSAHAGFRRHVGDTARLRNVAHRHKKRIGVGVFERGRNVLGNRLFVVEIVARN